MTPLPQGSFSQHTVHKNWQNKCSICKCTLRPSHTVHGHSLDPDQTKTQMRVYHLFHLQCLTEHFLAYTNCPDCHRPAKEDAMRYRVHKVNLFYQAIAQDEIHILNQWLIKLDIPQEIWIELVNFAILTQKITAAVCLFYHWELSEVSATQKKLWGSSIIQLIASDKHDKEILHQIPHLLSNHIACLFTDDQKKILDAKLLIIKLKEDLSVLKSNLAKEPIIIE